MLALVVGCSGSSAAPKDAAIPDAGGGTLVLSPTMYVFGDSDLAMPAPQTTSFVLQNQTAAEVAVTGATVTGSDFSLAENTCPGTLPAGAACSLSVAFQATAVGSRSGHLEVASTPPTSSAVFGTGVMTSHLRLAPGSVDLGDVAVGATGTPVEVTVTNDGAAATITPSITGGDTGSFAITATTCTGTIGVGGTCTIDVALAPTIGGQLGAMLVVTTGADTAMGGLSGVSTTPLAISPYKTVMPSMLIGQTPPSATISLVNNGGATTGSLTAASSSTEVAIQSTTCTTLAPGASCDVVVQLAPTGRGVKTAVVTISDGAAAARASVSASVYAVTLVGAATFPDTANGQTSAVQSYTVINASDATTGGINASLVGSEFAFASNTCGAGLAPHTSCTIGVRFAPTSAGAKTATLSVSASPGGSDALALSANAL